MSKRLRIATLIFTLLVSLPLAFFVQDWIETRIDMKDSSETKDCTTSSPTLTINDKYLGDVLKTGSQIRFIDGYYRCHAVERNDLVVFRVSTELPPVIRFVRGIPGDKFEVRFDEVTGKWEIFVNEKRLENTDGAYQIGHAKAQPPLKIDVEAFHGVIPEDRALILSQVPPGTSDSGTFGLVLIKDLIGKIAETGH